MPANPQTAPTTSRDSGTRIPVLDGLRGLAILLVVTHHFLNPETTGPGATAAHYVAQLGWTGVDLFFVLSGFLITGILLDTRGQPGYFRRFYLRRVLRIFPLYYTFLAGLIFIYAPLMGAGAAELTQRQAWMWTYLTNVDMVRHGAFTGDASVVNHLWSLAIEEQFYLVLPAVALLVAPRTLRILAALGIGGAIASRLYLQMTGHPAAAGFMFTTSHADGLAVGVILATLAWLPEGLEAYRRHAKVAGFAVVAALLAFRLWQPEFTYVRWSAMHVGLPLLALGFGALLLLTVTAADDSPLARFFSSSFLRFYGRYSYGLYVWHPFVSRLLRHVGFDQGYLARYVGAGAPAAIAALIIKGSLATGVALLSWTIIEQPFLRLKEHIPSGHRKPTAMAA